MGENVRIERLWPLSRYLALRSRRIEPEILDDIALEDERRLSALNGLRRINAVSLTAYQVWRPIRMLAHDRPLRVLDVASGAGDIPLALWRYARRARIAIDVSGCDKNPNSVEYANERARGAGAGVTFFVRDVVQDGIPSGYDAITCTLFMHHLESDTALKLLESMRFGGVRMVVVNDLCRCCAGYAVACVACRMLTRSDVVHYDGPRSVCAAYKPREFSALAERAGMRGHVIKWCWPFRFLFVWTAE